MTQKQPSDQAIIEAVSRAFKGCILREIEQSEKGITLAFETTGEQLLRMVVTPHMNISMTDKNLSAAVSLNLSVYPPLTIN